MKKQFRNKSFDLSRSLICLRLNLDVRTYNIFTFLSETLGNGKSLFKIYFRFSISFAFLKVKQRKLKSEFIITANLNKMLLFYVIL